MNKMHRNILDIMLFVGLVNLNKYPWIIDISYELFNNQSETNVSWQFKESKEPLTTTDIASWQTSNNSQVQIVHLNSSKS